MDSNFSQGSYTLAVSFNTDKRNLPDIYACILGTAALRLGHIYQANPFYNLHAYRWTHTPAQACTHTHAHTNIYYINVLCPQALQQAPADSERSSQAIHNYQMKLSTAERARDEALVKLDSLQAAHQRLEAMYV